jgi:hypothetical protein
MTKKKLIELLEKYSDDAQIVIAFENEYCVSFRPITHISAKKLDRFDSFQLCRNFDYEGKESIFLES